MTVRDVYHFEDQVVVNFCKDKSVYTNLYEYKSLNLAFRKGL